MDSSLKFIGLWFSIICVYDFICLQWLQPFPLWWNIICTESIKFTRQDSNGRAAAICRGKSFERLALGKTRLLWHKKLLYWWSALLPAHLAICYPAHVYISGWHWWELFLLPSPDYWGVMTHPGRLSKSWRSRAEFLEVQQVDIEAGCLRDSDEAAHNREKGLHRSYDCFRPNHTEVIISAEKQ